MIDEDEGEQHAAAGEIRPMLSIKQVLALIPFWGATLYRDGSLPFFPAAHEIALRRIAWFEDEVAAWQLGIKKVAAVSALIAVAANVGNDPRQAINRSRKIHLR